MSDKHLPIQFFEKRKDFDDRATEGGGSSTPPVWVLSGDELKSKSHELTAELEDVNDAYDRAVSSGAKLPLVVCTEINENAIAKSHRSNVTSLYTYGDHNNILGLSGNRCLLSIIADRAVFSAITNTLSDVHHQAKLISSITEISTFVPKVENFDAASSLYMVRLINYNDYDLNSFVKRSFENQCHETNISITRKTRFTKDMTIYRVCIDNLETMKLLEEFEGIYSIEKLIPIKAELDAIEINEFVPHKSPLVGAEYPIVGVLDTGIEGIAPLLPWKHTEAHTSFPEEYQNHTHGTFVAGIIEYGDELNGSNYTALHGVKLFEAIV